MNTKVFILLALLTGYLFTATSLYAAGGSLFFPGSVVTASAEGTCSAAKTDDIRLDPAVATISTAGLKAIIDSEVALTIVDARDPKYTDGKQIDKAIPLTIANSDSEVTRLIPGKNQLIVVYCGDLECPASQYMAQRLSDMGYTSVIEYPYGIKGWLEARLPVTRVKRRR